MSTMVERKASPSSLVDSEKESLSSFKTTTAPYNDWPNNIGFITTAEQKVSIELTVKGSIPDYVRGVLYRTGPGGNDTTTGSGKTITMDHWFDGFSRVHRFEIDSSDKVFYRSRTICDGLIERVRKTGSANCGGEITFGQQDPCQTLFRKFMSVFNLKRPMGTRLQDGSAGKDGANCGVTLTTNAVGLQSITADNTTGHGGIRTLHTMTDANVIQEIDPETLEPVGLAKQTVLHPSLDGQFSAAHGCHDHVNGDFFNYNLLLGKGKPAYRVFKVDGVTGKTSILATIRDAPACYIHSSFLTSKYIILCIWPAILAYGGITLPFEKNVVGALSPWSTSNQAYFYVIDRQTNGRGLIQKFTSDGFFAFHSINAWDEGDDIVMEIPIYDNIDILSKFYITNLMSTSPNSEKWIGKSKSQMTRFRLRNVEQQLQRSQNILPAAVVDYKDTECSMELPVINPDYAIKPHRYVYGIIDRGRSTFIDGLAKYDNQSHTQTIWDHQGHTPGEPIFVADPNGQDEDDGVLLSVVLDGGKEKSYLMVLNAKDMKEVARAEMETVVQFGFHGTYHSTL